jgi:tetratricopeptide (TPR) repeat protein
MADPTTPSSGGVFISYRRQETAPYARLLREELSKRLGSQWVFMDIDSIDVGVDFAEAIDRAVNACQVLLALMGPQWLSITDAEGQRRLDNPDDTVRLEIEAALARDIRVIPVLVDNTPMPGRQQLPDTLMPLARRNALELSYNRYAYDLQRLLEAVERTVGHTDAASSSAPSAAPESSSTSGVPIGNVQRPVVSSAPTGAGNPPNVVQLINQAEAFQRHARFDEAVAALDRALELDPRNTDALTVRGDTFRMMMRHEDAIRDLDRAIQLDPNDPRAFRVRGDTYLWMERHEDAIRELTRAIQLDPNDPEAFRVRGDAYQKMERHEDAIRDLTRAQGLNPNDNFAFLLRGRSYQATQQYHLAIADLDRALELEPHSALALVVRGETFRLMGRYKEASRDLYRALKVEPGYSLAHYELRQLPWRFQLRPRA